MTTAHFARRNLHPNGQDVRLARLADSQTVDLRGRSVDEWNAADTAQRLTEPDDEARALNTAEEDAVTHAKLAAVWAQNEARAFARYHNVLHNEGKSDVGQGSVNIWRRPFDSRFGSDGNQYNPYSPHTSEEYMLQEIQAGRMSPDMMDMPRQPSNPAQSPLPDKDTADVHAGSHTLWMAPDPRPPYRQPFCDLEQAHDSSDPHEASWSQHPYADSTASEDLGEEEYADPVLHHILENEQSLIGSHNSLDNALDSTVHGEESIFGNQGPLTLPPARSSSSGRFATEVLRRPQSASTGRERSRLTRPSLVVKLKTRFTQKSSPAPLSPRRGRRDALSSNASNSAAQPTISSRPFNLRSQGSVGSSSATARSRAGWEQTALTRRTDADQSSQRKRRRDSVSPRDASVESAKIPLPDSTHGK